MNRIPFYQDPYFYRKHIYLLILYLISIIIVGFVPIITTDTCNVIPLGEVCEEKLNMIFFIAKISIFILGILALASITLYKKLQRLKTFIIITLIFHIILFSILLGLIFNANINFSINIGFILMSVIALPLLVAVISVKNDIKRLKSADRFV